MALSSYPEVVVEEAKQKLEGEDEVVKSDAEVDDELAKIYSNDWWHVARRS